jgi:curved DNA-binding protein CbpA
MNPYAVLGVSTNATDQEIKNAYRRLVKRYHPDRRSPEASHDQIAAINHAYDILSDPVKRAQYDRGFTQIFIEQQEDPVEAYKREFKRKRRQQEKKERRQALAHKASIYRAMRVLHIPILLFAIGLILYDIFTVQTVSSFRLVLLFNAGYVCYQKQRTDFAYKLSFFTAFLFAATLLSVLA